PPSTRSALFPYTALFRSPTVSGSGPSGAAFPAQAGIQSPYKQSARSAQLDPRLRGGHGGEGDGFRRIQQPSDPTHHSFPNKTNRSEEHTSELQSRENLVC